VKLHVAVVLPEKENTEKWRRMKEANYLVAAVVKYPCNKFTAERREYVA
jgi:hypothetical protein